MDMTMVHMGMPSGGSAVPESVLPGMDKADGLPLVKLEKAAIHPKPVAEQVAYNARSADKTRYENMLQASQLFKEVYAVSDTKFAIYKDFTGQFVTRFTNLRDGSVTYIPEPDMMQYLERRGAARKALLKIDV